MNTSDILKESEKLPLSKRNFIVESAMKSIHKKEKLFKMEEAATSLLSDYETDYELTSFTNIDFESFYETK